MHRALELRPDDAALRCNLALVLLLTSEIEASQSEVAKATRAEPDDPITRGLAALIDDVASGRRKRPRSIAETEGRKPSAAQRGFVAALHGAVGGIRTHMNPGFSRTVHPFGVLTEGQR